MAGKEKWYPGKHLIGAGKGLLGKLRDHSAKFEMGGEYGLKTPDQQADMAWGRARAMPDDDARAAISQNTARGAAQASSSQQGRGGMPAFDPNDQGSVLQMQEYLNRAGYTDRDGNQLTEDGRLGELTTSAMRRMQGQNYDLQGSSIDSQSARGYTSDAYAPEGFSGESVQVPGGQAMGPGGRMQSYGGFEIPSLSEFNEYGRSKFGKK